MAKVFETAPMPKAKDPNWPMWWCVKMILHTDGRIEADFVRDEKTKMAIAFRAPEKPLDGVFETLSSTTYYSYHDEYADAARQIAAATV